jgi:hypothetical protein
MVQRDRRRLRADFMELVRDIEALIALGFDLHTAGEMVENEYDRKLAAANQQTGTNRFPVAKEQTKHYYIYGFL